MYITLVTHAESDNFSIDCNDSAFKLTEDGIKQSKLFGKQLTKYFDIVYSAPRRDCINTALLVKQEYNRFGANENVKIINHPQVSCGIRILTGLKYKEKETNDIDIFNCFSRIIQEMTLNHQNYGMIFTEAKWLKVLLHDVFNIIPIDKEINALDAFEIENTNGVWKLSTLAIQMENKPIITPA